MRELEREFNDLNKEQKDTLKIYEKLISTRMDRVGAIRNIDKIIPSDRGKRRNSNILFQNSFLDNLKDNNG